MAAAGAVAVGGVPNASAAAGESSTTSSDVVPFLGTHQAGIATPVQDRMHTVAFDLTLADPASVVRLLKQWTDAGRRMTAGREVGEGAIPGIDPEQPLRGAAAAGSEDQLGEGTPA